MSKRDEKDTVHPVGVQRRPLGHGGPDVAVVSVGTSPLGSNPGLYGYEVDEARAVATIGRALESSINFLDTSNEYGEGESERRIGSAIRQAGGLPDNFVLATKADAVPGQKSFSGQRVWESLGESFERLGVHFVELFHLHDPERFDFADLVAPGGAVDAMVELKHKGSVGLIGVAGGDIDEMRRYVDLGVFDVLLNHSRYTLLDQSADALFDHARSAGVTLINAAPYGSGMLAKPASAAPNYQYNKPSAEIKTRTEAIRNLCARYDVPMAALALQFSTRDPRITSTVVGVSSPDRVDAMIRNANLEIPSDLWQELSSLLGFVPRAVTK